MCQTMMKPEQILNMIRGAGEVAAAERTVEYLLKMLLLQSFCWLMRKHFILVLF